MSSSATTPPAPPPTGFDPIGEIRNRLGQEANIETDFAQDYYFVSADRLRLRLREFAEAVKARIAWQVPVSLLLGLAGILITLKSAGEFGTLLWLNKDGWIGVSALGIVLCLVWLGFALQAAFAAKDPSIEDVVRGFGRDTRRVDGPQGGPEGSAS